MTLYYHLFNRGVDKRPIFMDNADRQRFIDALRLARLSKSTRLSYLKRQLKLGTIKPSDLENLEEKYGPPHLDVIAYALMPNHFHLQVKELRENGVSDFFRKLGTSYAMYFNTKYERTGRLFESKYKSVLIETDEQLIHLSRYIHANPVNSSRTKISPEKLKSYPWTSLPNYLGFKEEPFCNPSEVMAFFEEPRRYWNFLKGGFGEELNLPEEMTLDQK